MFVSTFSSRFAVLSTAVVIGLETIPYQKKPMYHCSGVVRSETVR
jgi:hypothetical protein